MKNVVVVTGASSGFGALAARALARAGNTVYAWSEILADEVIGTASKGDRGHHVQFCGSVKPWRFSAVRAFVGSLCGFPARYQC